MITIKNKVAIGKMREAGRLLAEIMGKVQVLEGTTTLEIDSWIENEMQKCGLVAVCKGYGGYRYATCISLNDEVIHGIPSNKVILKSGDFVKIDVAGSYKGYCVDMTRYFFVGAVKESAKKLAETAQRALDRAIKEIMPGKHLSDISASIQGEVERAGFGIVRDFAGHGIGKKLHEDPQIPNFGVTGEGPILREGMVFAIEPMITEKSEKIKIMGDKWTVKTVDGGLAAHVEDTVAVASSGAEVLTRL
jgi:methionyl aminopeptidase